MTPRLVALLGRVFAHRYPGSVDPVDFREARAWWLAEQARSAGTAPVTYATATGQPWPVDNVPPSYGVSREEAWGRAHPAPCDFDQH